MEKETKGKKTKQKAERETDRQTDRQTDKQSDKKTNRNRGGEHERKLAFSVFVRQRGSLAA